MPRRLQVPLLLLCGALALGFGKRSKGILVSFHVETEAADAPKFAFARPDEGSGSMRYYRKVPEFSDDEIAWFYPFSAQDGGSFGVVFKLDEDGTRHLENVSAENPGRYFLTMIHPGHSSAVIIDKVISDGIVVVWDGLTPEHIDVFRKKMDEWEGDPPKQ